MLERDDALRIFGVTSVENLFFTQYMSDADGDFVKVYLSCLYHSQLGDTGFGIAEIANELNLEKSRVEAALRYWERRRLLTRKSDDPPRYVLHSLGEHMLTGKDSFRADDEYLHFSESVYALFGDRRKIRPSEIATAYEWVKDLSLEPSIVLMLLSYCISARGINFTFSYAGKMAVKIKEEGIESADEAEKFFSRSEKIREGARSVLKRFGQRRRPTEDEINMYETWVYELGFTDEDILSACRETVKATNPSFAYLNGILQGLKKRSGGETVKAQLKSEDILIGQTKEVLNALGVRTSAQGVQNAYKNLLTKYPHEIYLLAAKDARRRNLRFEDLLPIADSWNKKGLDTVEKIEKHLSEMADISPLAKKVLAESGQEGSPTSGDLKYINTWLESHNEEIILYAASLSRSAKQKMPYIDKVLSSFKDKSIKTIEQAKSTAPMQKGTVTAQKYQQRSYTEEELSRSALDLLKEAEIDNE